MNGTVRLSILAIVGVVMAGSTLTFDDLTAKVRRQLQDAEGNYWTDAEIQEYLDEGQLEYARKTRALRGSAPITVKENNETYRLPDDCLEVIRLEDSDGNEIPRSTSDGIQRSVGNFRNRSQGVPANASTAVKYAYSDLDGNGLIRLYPAPNPTVEEDLVDCLPSLANLDAGLDRHRIGINGNYILYGRQSANEFYVVGETNGYLAVQRFGEEFYPEELFVTSISYDSPACAMVYYITGSTVILVSTYGGEIHRIDFDLRVAVTLDKTALPGGYAPFRLFSQYFDSGNLSFMILAECDSGAGGSTFYLTRCTVTTTAISDTATGLETNHYNLQLNTGYDFFSDGGYAVTGTQGVHMVGSIGVATTTLVSTATLTANSLGYAYANPVIVGNSAAGYVYFLTEGLSNTHRVNIATQEFEPNYFTDFMVRGVDSDGVFYGFTDTGGNDVYYLDEDGNPVQYAEMTVPSATFIHGGRGITFKDGRLAVATFVETEGGGCYGVNSIESSNHENGCIVDLESSSEDDIIEFDGEDGFVCQVVQTSVGLYCHYVRSPIIGAVEIQEPLALTHYALYKCYEKDSDKTAMERAMYHLGQFQNILKRDIRRSSEGFNNARPAVQGYYF